MLSKVTQRVKLHSTQPRSLKSSEQQSKRHQVLRVDIAPELLRWSDFSTPFPSVAIGGYSRFYETHPIPESTQSSLNFCPLLSQYPEPSPSSQIPPKSPLFNILKRRCLSIIREVSLESLALNKPRNLTISTIPTTPQHSLKRRRKQIFQTPSITERDFVLYGGRCQSPSESETSNVTVISAGTPSSSDIPSSATRSISSTDSHLSHERSSDSEMPITPSTSIDSNGNDDDDERFSAGLLDQKLSPHKESESECCEPTRPISTVSFCTANTGFSEI